MAEELKQNAKAELSIQELKEELAKTKLLLEKEKNKAPSNEPTWKQQEAFQSKRRDSFAKMYQTSNILVAEKLQAAGVPVEDITKKVINGKLENVITFDIKEDKVKEILAK